MTILYEWAAEWGVSMQAVKDLEARMGVEPHAPGAEPGRSEASVQSRVRLEAARKGIHLFRNNVGAFQDAQGNWVRYGLANDSKRVNEQIKSSDLIGWRSIRIEPHHVGSLVAQFVAREVKEQGWVFTGTPRELAQFRFIELVASSGGDARFAEREGTL